MATENLSRIASDFETQLSGAISVGATSFTIQSVLDFDGVTLSDGIYCFTIDRDSTGAKEYLIGQLTNATKTVSSISSVGRQGVLTANAQRAHRIGANVIISDHSILSAISRIFSGQGTINPAAPLEYTTAPTLSSATQIATKGYVDGIVSGGTVNTDRIILGSQTAGETVAAGNIVYFKSSDSRWWLADADLTATFSNVQLGVALGAGTAGNTISGGVQIYGKCDSFTGLTATATYYLSNTAGAVSASAGTNSVILGQAFSATGIFFNPGPDLPFFVSTSAGAGDSGKGVRLNASGVLDDSFTGSNTQTFSANGTWTKPNGAKFVTVELFGAGGGGGSGRSVSSVNDAAGGGGGGGGSYSKHIFLASNLGATETVTVGTGGSGGATRTAADGLAGSAGGTTSFGTWINAIGGNGGSGGLIGGGGAGGTASVGFTINGVTGARGGINSEDGLVGTTFFIMPTGGGGGGGTTGTARSGGAGGALTPYSLAGGAGGAGNADNATAGNTPSNTTEMIGGTGGGGGGSSAFGSGVAGGTGRSGGRAAGGGGGGAAGGDQVSGAGGTGGNGFARIISYN